MALDAEEVATRARERLTELGEDVAGLTIPRLTTFVSDAVKELARAGAEGRLFLKDYELNSDGGDCPLADALSDDEPLLLDFVAQGSSLYLGDSESPAKPVADRGFQAVERAGRSSWCVEGESLRIKGPKGWYTGGVKLSASCVPSLERVARASADGRLVDIVAAMGAADLAKAKKPSSKGAPTR